MEDIEDMKYQEQVMDIKMLTKSVEVLEVESQDANINIPSIEVPLELELKQLPSSLQYDFLEADQKLPVIISSNLTEDQRYQLLELLKR